MEIEQQFPHSLTANDKNKKPSPVRKVIGKAAAALRPDADKQDARLDLVHADLAGLPTVTAINACSIRCAATAYRCCARTTAA